MELESRNVSRDVHSFSDGNAIDMFNVICFVGGRKWTKLREANSRKKSLNYTFLVRNAMNMIITVANF